MTMRSAELLTLADRYIGYCCREWILSYQMPPGQGKCGLCGEVPTYLRPWSEDEEKEL